MASGKTFRSLLALLAFLPLCAAQEAAAPARRSVLLISLDTTRRDYVGFMGRTPSPTPALDRLAAKSLVFADAVTAVPITLPSHSSLFTGLYPGSHGVRDNALYHVPASVRTLAEILGENGWRSRAAVAAFVLDPIFGLDQGFERYRAPPRTIATPGAPAKTELDAKTMVDRALEDLAELASPPGATGEAPFFYWLHLFDAHFPYAPADPPQLTKEQAADPRIAGKLLYEAEIRGMDRELGRLFGALEASGLIDRLVIVVTADHGESLHDAPEGAHGFFLYDPTVRVPLFVRSPDLAPGRVDLPVSLVDVVPTLLALLGIDAGAEKFDGIDLLPWIRDPARAPPERTLQLETFLALSDFGWAPSFGCVQGPVKYVRSVREELFDRASDPAERRNLFTPDDPRAVGLSRRVDGYLASAASLGRASLGLSQADRARLQALGYTTGGAATELPENWRELPDALLRIGWMDRFNDALIAQERGDVPRAIELLRALVAQEPTSATAREQLAITLLRSGLDHADEAAEQFDAAVRLDPRRGRAWMLRAQCDEIAAERARLAANQLRAQGKSRQELRPLVEAERKAHEQAEFALRQSLACEPDGPEALLLLARALAGRAEREARRNAGDAALAALDEAGALLERLLQLLPSDAPDRAEADAARAQMAARRAELAGSAGKR